MKILKFLDLVYFQEGPGILSKQFKDKGVKLLNVRNIVNGKLDISNTATCISEDEAFGKYKHFLIEGDEILIASSGIKVEYFDKKVCFANKEYLPLMLNTSIIRLKSLDENKLLKGYLYYFLKSIIFKSQIQRLITGSAQLNFGPSHLKQIQIPLPPIQTQKQIIHKLDKLNNLIELRKQSIQKTEQLTKSIFIEMFGDPMINPKGWEVKKLEKLCNKITDGTHKTPIYQNEGVIFLSAKNISSYEINLSDIKYLSQEEHNKLIKRSKPEKGDILLAKSGTIGIAVKINIDLEFSIFESLALLKLINNSINGDYLTFFLNSDFAKNQYLSNTKGNSIKHLHIIDIKNLNILTPPLPLQNKFAQIVQKNEENIKKQKESLKKLEELYNATMQENFSF